MNHKTLGSIALAGAPLFLLSGWLEPFFTSLHPSQFYGAWTFVYIGAWMCSIRGLQLSGAAGQSKWGKGLLWVQMTALLLANLSNLYQVIQPGAATTLFFILDAFWPLSNLLMLAVGITVVVAKKWKGWRRYVPLLVGCWLPVLWFSMMLFGKGEIAGIVGGTYSAFAWGLLAIVIITAKRNEQPIKSQPHTLLAA